MVPVDEATTLHTGTPPVTAETPAPTPAPTPTEPPTRPGPAIPRIRRRRQGAVIAGVTGGVADHLGVDVLRVRLVFVLLVAAAGAGFVAYAGLWLFCPIEPRGVRRDVPPRERRQGLGLATLGVLLAFILSGLGGQLSGWVIGPLVVVVIGVALVWREADTGGAAVEGETGWRARWLVGRRLGLLRLLAGALLVTMGIAVFLLGNVDLGQVQFGVLAALATLAGVVVITVPWWMRLVRELGTERRERIRGQERADIAAHLHDSVLQTLALIQKQAGEDVAGREVRRLARSQERELRAWLYGPPGGDAGRPAGSTDATLAAALATAAGEVEDDYGVRVAPVVVGDTELDPNTTALVAAAREAMVNAAKHAGVDEIDVYVEVEPDVVEVFVRDRGRGFDPDAVPEDRRGLAGSVRDRMTRHGGRVRLRTAPGEGTEVGLVLPRSRRGTPAPATAQEESR
ncbi:phage shock protein C (PspC) family protein [Actinomycetospora succinea]|uniref:Phage shock protein C (PspC) family protein n=1 Tax=Actinomycetospora succinea TaxID=663603 RepID=A0A4R6UNG9_9PSEU|nr:phage shock protein C (PspC) family protein [Actinomycetospora succinea]